ncbi:MAG: radical SAM protein, partial [Candidatus Eisenbacteria bacterium]|nr:radical SAM protein [Candidatus Eisenbacteria bacterium]
MQRFEFNSRSRRLKRYLGITMGRPLVGPQVVSLETTHHCNLRCSFCESHGLLLEKPITATRSYVGDRKKMDLETIRRLAKELADVGTDLVELSGKGDPIAHPQPTEIVRAIKDAGLACALVTNGTLAKPDLAPTLIERGLDRLNVSLNGGTREAFLRSNHRDLWDKAIGFLGEVMERRRQAGAPRPWVRVSHVVSKENVDTMDQMVQVPVDLGVDEG